MEDDMSTEPYVFAANQGLMGEGLESAEYLATAMNRLVSQGLSLVYVVGVDKFYLLKEGCKPDLDRLETDYDPIHGYWFVDYLLLCLIDPYAINIPGTLALLLRLNVPLIVIHGDKKYLNNEEVQKFLDEWEDREIL
jgi:hypothetical protein